MAFKIIWSEPALGDLRSLTSFIAEDNPAAAEKIGAAILGKTRHLIEHPLLGRMVPEIRRKDVRELIQRPYRILYRVNARNKTVEIIRVWHAARGEPEIF
jgi:addiction module RelE/StbE family toxin